MSKEVLNFIPLAGLMLGLIVAFAFDATAERAAWWGVPAGLVVGLVAQFALKRYHNAR